MTTRILRFERIENRMREPFKIAGYEFHSMPAIVASISQDGHSGVGEAAGVYYLDDDPTHMAIEIEGVRGAIESGATRAELLHLLPPGGARNVLDCALWDLEARQSGTPAWRLAGLDACRPLVTTFTLPADTPETILDRLAAFPTVKAIKLKLDGDLPADIERVQVVRRARPDVWLGVDANQGYDAANLDALAAELVASRVSLLEQPIRRGQEDQLDGWRCPIAVAADESVLDTGELEKHRNRFDVINIKLDKCGGLTEALRMVALARRFGLKVMVGNMAGSSIAMAPAAIVGQSCDIVDLDGAWFLADDPVADRMYHDGMFSVPAGLWGGI